MPRILIVHWNREEAAERAGRVRQAGFEADTFWQPENGAALRELRANVPDAVVIDLTRIPSHGRAVGVFLRGQKATRGVPLLFIEGDPAKTARTRELLPDAVYTTWEKIAPALRKALRGAPARPIVPGTFAGYSGTPLNRKLRIVEGSRVLLLAAPEDFESCLEPLPEGASVSRAGETQADVILAFVRSSAALGRALPAAGARDEGGPDVVADLAQEDLRAGERPGRADGAPDGPRGGAGGLQNLRGRSDLVGIGFCGQEVGEGRDAAGEKKPWRLQFHKKSRADRSARPSISEIQPA